MKNFLFILLMLFVFLSISTAKAQAQDKEKSLPQVEIIDDSLMEKLAKLQEPSEQQKMLSALAGTWYYTLKYWDKDGAELQISTGIITNEMLVNGRYLLGRGC